MSTPTTTPTPVLPTLSPHRDRTTLVALGAFALAAAGVCVAYWAVTGHVWEDFLITFRFSKNLVDGQGLVFNPGERVQGFTSPINTFLPAFFYAISDRSGFEFALNGYRVVSILAFVAGGALILRTMLADRGGDRWSPLIYALLFVTEAKTVAYTVNGQESAFMVLFMLLGLVGAYGGMGRRWGLNAAAWTGLCYTRPDAAIFIAALVAAGLAFSTEPRRQAVAGVLKAAIATAILYAPWVVFATVYYGQPIPNTVLAKATQTPTDLLNPVGVLRLILTNYPITMSMVFEPIYASFGGWPHRLMDPFTFACGALCSAYWAVPSTDRLGRMASAGFCIVTAYFCYQNIAAFACPWYLPSGAALGLVVLARAVPRTVAWLRVVPCPVWVSRAVQVLLVASAALLLAGTMYQIRIQQAVVETGNRAKVGVWLKENADPRDVIYLEPLGYVGYYSQRYIQDWPGLIAPEVARLRREKLPQHMTHLIPVLRPDWVVLRPVELAIALRLPDFARDYEVKQVFDARPKLEEYGWIPGRNYVVNDACFFVLRRASGRGG